MFVYVKVKGMESFFFKNYKIIIMLCRGLFLSRYLLIILVEFSNFYFYLYGDFLGMRYKSCKIVLINEF